jgi:dTDP-4-dehydrorhamnose reductase
MAMKILIIGADGQLGTDLCKAIPGNEQIPLTIKDIDITDKAGAAAVIKKYAPQIVINTAGYSRVDDCEDYEAQAFAVNTLGVKYLAQACQTIDAALVHISTDYVFDGEKGSPYTEADAPAPLSTYGVSKLAGEFCVKYLLKKYYLVRTTGLYGCAGCLGKGGGNFVDNIIERAQAQKELKVVTDEVMSPTYSLDLAKKIYGLVKTGRFGLYHIVNHGECSWHDFAVKIFELLGKPVAVKKISVSDLRTKARRPVYSALENAALRSIGLDDMRSWPEALAAYLMEKGLIKEGAK